VSYFEDPAEFAVADARHVLLAGDESSIGELSEVLALLPICARGQVFVEVDDAASIATLQSPGRVVVTWLVRAVRSGEPGTGASCARGQVFVEVDDAASIATLQSPGRVVVTWLVRAVRSGEPGTGASCARGQAAARATRAWASEMLDVEGHESAEYHVWIGGETEHLTGLRNDLRMTLAGMDARLRRRSEERASH
jgi:NADPH-dependent ferric siderophore reductase